MIRVEDLHFSYGKREILKGINFEASPGELLCVLGHNGAGKTTLFKCMLGLLKGYSGKILIDDRDIAHMTPRERALSVAYIPQTNHPVFAYSAIDMVLMGTSVRANGASGPSANERIISMNALEKIGIGHLAERDYTKILGGEQQMVLIARAIAQGARILVMDEPTTSLDYGNQMRVQKQLKSLAAEGYTIIQSTHNPEQTYMFADRIVCIKDGRVHRQGLPAEVMDEKLIRDLYGIEARMITSEDEKARFFELI